MIKILMYHRVVKDEKVQASDRTLCIPEAVFRSHLEFLVKWGFTAITFNDYRLSLLGDLSLPKKPVILSFDDGYLDTYEIAFPLLQQFGMKGIVFVLGDQKIRYSKWDDGIMESLAPLMEPGQLLEMLTAGWEIGSHSMSHQKLTQLPQPLAWEEISRSRILLEILLNAPVKTFSYPYGLVNASVKSMVHDAGYSHGCGVFTGPPVFGADQFEIRRIPIFGNTDPVRFGLRMLTGYEYYAWLRGYSRSMYHTVFRHPNGKNGWMKSP